MNIALVASSYADIVVVVSANNEIDELSKKQIVNIFMGKVNEFPDGSFVTPIDQAPNSKVREKFYKKMTNKTPSQIGAYWAKLLFTGRHVPPRVVDNNAEILDVFLSNASAIAYMNEEDVTEDYKVVYTIDLD